MEKFWMAIGGPAQHSHRGTREAAEAWARNFLGSHPTLVSVPIVECVAVVQRVLPELEVKEVLLVPSS